jgi:transcription antitermination factor NusG
MTWYAIRTKAGAQQPQREYAVETTALGADGRPLGKGYRIVPSLSKNVSAVERALSRAGYQHYMPAEYKVVRNRRKTGVYEVRRFALLPGWMFIVGRRTRSDGTQEEELNGDALRKVPGVAGVLVSVNGIERRPMEIPIFDIMKLRTIEAANQSKADKEVAVRNSAERASLNKTAQKAVAAAKRKLNVGQNVKILWGRGVGHEATLLGWEDSQHVKAVMANLRTGEVEEISIPYDGVRLLEAAE